MNMLFAYTLVIAVIVYVISWNLVIRGIRRNLLLLGYEKIVRVGRIHHRVSGEESRPCDNVYEIRYENGRTRRVVEPSDSAFSRRLDRLAGSRLDRMAA